MDKGGGRGCSYFDVASSSLKMSATSSRSRTSVTSVPEGGQWREAYNTCAAHTSIVRRTEVEL